MMGESLIGATVVVKGTSTGTVTDVDGTYSINVKEDDATLIFSYTGFESVEQAIGTSNVIDIVMSAGVTFEEVVVTGQGVGIERKRLTTTVDAYFCPLWPLGYSLPQHLHKTYVQDAGKHVTGFVSHGPWLAKR